MVKMNYRELCGLPLPRMSRLLCRRRCQAIQSAHQNGAAMDPRHLGATPGSGGRGSRGSGGRSVDTSARRRRRMSTLSTGTRLMPEFNAVGCGGDGGSSGSSSSGGLDLGLHESHPRYNRHPVYPEVSPTPKMGRLLFLNSPMGSQTTDDEVLIMDGVLVANGSASTPRRSASFTDLGFVPADSPGSGGSGCYGPNRQFAHGREESRVVRTMNPRFSEVEPQGGLSAQGAGYNMQGAPRAYPLLPPSLPGAAGAPRGAAAIPVRPPAPPYFTPPRAATATTARAPGSLPAPYDQPAPPRATFAWPPTEEEDASISQILYGPGPSRRLPVFKSICPE